MPLSPGTILGPYRVLAPLGAGGMGEVYRAEDARLGRSVAIKVLPEEVSRDPERRARFEREARAIAALNHPNICAVHDIGQQDGVDFLVMELLEGESLADRLSRHAVPFDEACRLAVTILETLEAVHERGLIHRDLKPANIFLTRHGAKLLDFGLARTADLTDAADTRITQHGLVVGTPRYMAPEQLRGGPIDHRADLFAAGALLYEMLAGRAAFDGPSLVDIIHAVAFEEPPALPPGAAPSSFEATLRQALSKDPARRPASAAAFADALRQGSGSLTVAIGAPSARHALTRLIVLPFKLLRPDPETDFLGFSLPDAVSAALASLESVVVRSTLSAQTASTATDLRALAAQAQVDAVVTGSLLRAGGEVRVAAQLVAVPEGSLLWSHTMHAPVQDLFQLQDALTNAIVSALHVPLTARDSRALKQDVPASATAYELFLRGNQIAADSSRWLEVRGLYEQAVELDPGYAPAWARLGRVLRVIAKYGGRESQRERARAERAFERALALNPDLAAAHYLYAHLEAETGRAADAMVRLLTRARTRRGSPDLLAGLVTTCRYCGLLDESVAAYEQVRRLDPATRTSVAYTFYQLGDYRQAVATDCGSPPYVAMLARMRLGAHAEAVAMMAEVERSNPHPVAQLIGATYRLAMQQDVNALTPKMREMADSGFTDPEGYFLLAPFLAHAEARDPALATLERSTNGGFCCPSAMRDDAYWNPVRDDPTFARLLAQCESASARARDAFVKADGAAVLELSR